MITVADEKIDELRLFAAFLGWSDQRGFMLAGHEGMKRMGAGGEGEFIDWLVELAGCKLSVGIAPRCELSGGVTGVLITTCAMPSDGSDIRRDEIKDGAFVFGSINLIVVLHQGSGVMISKSHKCVPIGRADG